MSWDAFRARTYSILGLGSCPFFSSVPSTDFTVLLPQKLVRLHDKSRSLGPLRMITFCDLICFVSSGDGTGDMPVSVSAGERRPVRRHCIYLSCAVVSECMWLSLLLEEWERHQSVLEILTPSNGVRPIRGFDQTEDVSDYLRYLTIQGVLHQHHHRPNQLNRLEMQFLTNEKLLETAS